tara:strand:- start:11502 stop:13499 length:1998 start_codon:yes stop_codon:yes gene_type:complete
MEQIKSLTVNEIIKKIKNQETFEAVSVHNTFHLKIRDYIPFFCAAIHAGSNLRSNLKEKIIHNKYERWYEEDPHTDTFISSMPLTIVGLDSRFEYDLNRDPENCVYKDAWGIPVWKKPLSKPIIKESLQKHSDFYKVIDALIAVLEKKFNGCIVYDMHSYNYIRHQKELPVFNLGSKNINQSKFRKTIDFWIENLKSIQLRSVENTTEENGPFQGNGYFLIHISKKFKNTLVLATEVKKIYCDELNGNNYPLVINDLEEEFKRIIISTSHFFAENQLKLKVKRKSLLSTGIEDKLLKVDKELYQLTKKLEVLSYVTPLNLDSEQKKFLKNKGQENPNFKYRQIIDHPFEFKRKLYNLKLENVKDVSIAKLYTEVIQSYSDKIDMLNTIGTEKFFFNSLRYFGQPTETDLRNAHFILNCPNDEQKSKMINVEEVKSIFEKEISQYGFNADVEITKNITAEIMVLNFKRKVLLKHGCQLSVNSVKALVHHEIGVHMVTTMNAVNQPLNIFKLGFPNNTYTQEGIAVLTEYLSGHLTIKRLKELALRVVGVDLMINGLDFKSVYHEMVNSYYLPQNDAFILTTRIFRGGGFTKDHLYLKGFIKILKLWDSGKSLNPLLIGKNSIRYYDIYKEMIARELANPPMFTTSILDKPVKSKKEVEFVISGLRD